MRSYLLVLSLLMGGFLVLAKATEANTKAPFKNLVLHPEDKQTRASAGYMLHLAWVQITGQKSEQNTIAQTPLELAALSQHDFAVAWLGHATMLIKAGQKWILTDPIFSQHATPTPPFGPKRLAKLPLELKDLPHIDTVLISHDHYDHLDLETVKQLVTQSGGSPEFLVGLGLKDWFKTNVAGADVEEMQWWDMHKTENVAYQFVPAQHYSGKKFTNKNNTLWGSWVVEYDNKKIYFAGDTAYEAELFKKIKQKAGHLHLAALPIGAYLPHNYMRFEHMNPAEAPQAHDDLQPTQSIAIHWGTFQLGDETSDEVRDDFMAVLAKTNDANFKLVAIGDAVQLQAKIEPIDDTKL
jgi:N-acyl-phosphatidylethanolamine-hydrolysing phospholipase D